MDSKNKSKTNPKFGNNTEIKNRPVNILKIARKAESRSKNTLNPFNKAENAKLKTEEKIATLKIIVIGSKICSENNEVFVELKCAV